MRTAKLLAIVLGLGACLPGLPTETGDWGLGDDPGCAQSSLECWTTDETRAVHAITRQLNEGVAEPTAARADVLREATEGALALRYKLSGSQVEALEAERDALAGNPELDDDDAATTATRIRAAGVLDLEGGMIGAYAAPLEAMLQAQAAGVTGSGAGAVDPFEWAKNVVIPASYPEDIKRSLKDMMTTPVGAATAAALIWTGVLELDYRVENAKLFGEYIPPSQGQPARFMDSGLSPQAKVEKIIAREALLAGVAGTATAAGSLVLPPAAGAMAGMAVESVVLFHVHMAMAFRIAQVYGWDALNGPNLILLVSLVQGEGLLFDGADILLTNVLLPVAMVKVARRFGLATADEVLRAAFTGLWERLKVMWSRETAEKLAREAAEQGSRAILRQAFGWITFGAITVVSGVSDYAATYVIGHRLAKISWRWLSDFLDQGSIFMGRREARDCAFEVYGLMLGADGTQQDVEKKLLLGYLAKHYYIDEKISVPLQPGEIRSHGERIRAAIFRDGSTDVPACVDAAFAPADEEHRTVFLAHLYALMQIDLDEAPAERALYRGVRAKLEGSTFRSLDQRNVNDIERSILVEISLRNKIVAGDQEYDTQRDFGLEVEDLIPAMSDEVTSTVRPAFEEGFGGPF